MSIRQLNEQEIQQVAGGALPTQFVALDSSFNSLVANTTSAKVDIGKVASCCCACHCCGTHSNMNLGGELVNPVAR